MSGKKEKGGMPSPLLRDDWAFSTDVLRPPSHPFGDTFRTSGERLLTWAEYWIGLTEKTGNNDGSIVEKFLRHGLAEHPTGASVAGLSWCASFVLTGIKACFPGDDGDGSQLCTDRQFWGLRKVSNMEGLFAALDLLVEGPPKPGDIFFQDNHTGIVRAVGPNGELFTVEGNLSNMVRRNRRPKSLGGWPNVHKLFGRLPEEWNKSE